MAHGHLSRCRNCATFCVRSATLFAGIFATLACVGVSAARNEGGSPRAPEQLLDEAVKAKASGQPAVAYALLRQVVSIAPDNSLARWQLGQVKVGNEWLSVEEAQRRAEADPRQIRYQERKESLGDSPQAQLALARWCRGNKLEEEAKVHLASVLSVDPKNKEALRAAQMRWHDGQLKSVAEIREE
jgi:hypothetical protein